MFKAEWIVLGVEADVNKTRESPPRKGEEPWTETGMIWRGRRRPVPGSRRIFVLAEEEEEEASFSLFFDALFLRCPVE